MISFGKGGTGNTKRHYEAAEALSLLDSDFRTAAVACLDQYIERSGRPVGQMLADLHKKSLEMGFVHEGQDHINRRLGYDRSLSNAERMGFAMLLLGLGLAGALAKYGNDGEPSGGEAVID